MSKHVHGCSTRRIWRGGRRSLAWMLTACGRRCATVSVQVDRALRAWLKDRRVAVVTAKRGKDA